MWNIIMYMCRYAEGDTPYADKHLQPLDPIIVEGIYARLSSYLSLFLSSSLSLYVCIYTRTSNYSLLISSLMRCISLSLSLSFPLSLSLSISLSLSLSLHADRHLHPLYPIIVEGMYVCLSLSFSVFLSPGVLLLLAHVKQFWGRQRHAECLDFEALTCWFLQISHYSYGFSRIFLGNNLWSKGILGGFAILYWCMCMIVCLDMCMQTSTCMQMLQICTDACVWHDSLPW